MSLHAICDSPGEQAGTNPSGTISGLQTRIVKAVRTNNKEKVRSLQRLLARSLAGKLIAVDNKKNDS